jgi:hypothetical protein
VSSVSAELERLAIAVQFLAPSRHDPEKFHIDKSEIVNSLRDLAARNGNGGRRWWQSDRPGASEV